MTRTQHAAAWLGAALLLFATATAAPAADEQASPVLTGAPVGTTAESNPTIDVADPSATRYKYSINRAPYSDPVPIDAPLSLRANVAIGGETFVAGSRELAEFINRRTDEFSVAPFIGQIAVEDVESQLQITYLLNRLRAAVLTHNTLNLRGADVNSLRVSLIESAAVPSVNELHSFVVSGGELIATETINAVKQFSLRLPLGTTSATITPVTTDPQTAITVNGSVAASGSAVVIENLLDGASVTLSAGRPQANPTTYLLTVTHTDTLPAETSYKGYYLKAAAPASTFVSITNEGEGTVDYALAFNNKLGLTTAGIIDEIARMPSEFPGESVARKTWRFIRANRYHFESLTTAPWFSVPSLFFNSAGFGLCGDVANLFYHLMTAMGYSARVWVLGGHIVAEALVDGRWEMWDPDLEVYYYNSEGSVAGVNELIAQPELITNPIDPIITESLEFPWLIAYTQYVADIYSSANDNFLFAVEPDLAAAAPLTVGLPPKATFEFPNIFDAPPTALFASKVPAYTNARLVVQPGFTGAVSASLIVHSIGFSATPSVSVITGTAEEWTSAPAVASWIYDSEPPTVTASQPSGHYNVDEPVTLLASEAATIFFTIDGSTPTTQSATYTDPVTVGAGGSILFFATDAVGNSSGIRSYGPPLGGVTLQSSFSGSLASFVAQASGGAGSYEYMYLLRTPDGSWSYKRTYSPDPTWTWDTSPEPLGRYVVEVWARNVGESATPHGAVATKTITVDGPPVTAVDFISSLPSPQVVGSQVTLTASATGTTGNYEYQFLLRSPDGVWSIVQPYSSAPSWTWNTGAGTVGGYVIQVWARNAGAAIGYAAFIGKGFTIDPPPVTQVVMTTTVPTPQPVGTSVTFRAQAVGVSGNYEYQFVLRNPAGAWSIVQTYSTADNWILNPAAAPGSYIVQVWARNAGTAGAYDAWAGMQFELLPPPVASVTLATSAPTPQIIGAQVTFNANATGTTGNYEYQFVLRNPSGVWTIVQPYDSASTWTWNTGTGPAGGYFIQVWARNAGSANAYEAYIGRPFDIVPPPVTAVALVTNAPTPQITGSQVTFTASATGATGNYEYQFVLRNPTGQWTIVQPYGSASTWTWNTGAGPAGGYFIQVWARNAGSTNAYEAYIGRPFDVLPPPVTAVAVATDVPTPQFTGAQVTFTATATGTSGHYEYLFVLRNPSGMWTIVQPYGSGSTWTWNTGSAPEGGYFIQVWARNVGSTSAYEAYIGAAFSIDLPDDD